MCPDYGCMCLYVCGNESITKSLLPFYGKVKMMTKPKPKEDDFSSSFSITMQKSHLIKLNLVIKLIGIGHVWMRRP